MKKVFMLGLIGLAFGFGSCKKCWKCNGVMVDGNKTTQKVCNAETKDYYENAGIKCNAILIAD